MKINVEVDVFDDPEYCDSKSGLYWCAYIEDSNYCGKYCVQISGMRRQKCEPCKKAYEEATK